MGCARAAATHRPAPGADRPGAPGPDPGGVHRHRGEGPGRQAAGGAAIVPCVGGTVWWLRRCGQAHGRSREGAEAELNVNVREGRSKPYEGTGLGRGTTPNPLAPR